MINKMCLLLVCLLIISQPLFAKSFCETGLFKDKVSQIGNIEKVKYSDTTDAYKNKKELNLLISQPRDELLSGKRPAIIFVHSGGFMECLRGGDCYEKTNKELINPEFTTRGFVTVSVEYRLNKFNPLAFFKDEELVKAQIRAIQDVRNAVKFVFDNAEKYNIDKEKIFLSGYSAGAIAILHATFMDEKEASQTIFKEIGDLAPKQNLKGLIPIAGSIYDLEFIDADEKIPTLLIHGQEDFIVPFGEGSYFNNFLLSSVYGSSKIADQLTKQGNVPETLFIEGMGHNF